MIDHYRRPVTDCLSVGLEVSEEQQRQQLLDRKSDNDGVVAATKCNERQSSSMMFKCSECCLFSIFFPFIFLSFCLSVCVRLFEQLNKVVYFFPSYFSPY